MSLFIPSYLYLLYFSLPYCLSIPIICPFYRYCSPSSVLPLLYAKTVPLPSSSIPPSIYLLLLSHIPFIVQLIVFPVPYPRKSGRRVV
jgi:hypothetical protein